MPGPYRFQKQDDEKQEKDLPPRCPEENPLGDTKFTKKAPRKALSINGFSW
jgi:hypothetical protein